MTDSYQEIGYLILSILSLGVGIMLWKGSGTYWEFDGKWIVQKRRNGKITERILIDEISEIKSEEDDLLTMKSKEKKISIFLTKELKKKLAEQVSSYNSGQSLRD